MKYKKISFIKSSKITYSKINLAKYITLSLHWKLNITEIKRDLNKWSSKPGWWLQHSILIRNCDSNIKKLAEELIVPLSSVYFYSLEVVLLHVRNPISDPLLLAAAGRTCPTYLHLPGKLIAVHGSVPAQNLIYLKCRWPRKAGLVLLRADDPFGLPHT